MDILNAPNTRERRWVVIRSPFTAPYLAALAPTVGHESMEEAMKEAHRLAVANPNSLFWVAEIANGVQSEVVAYPLIDDEK